MQSLAPLAGSEQYFFTPDGFRTILPALTCAIPSYQPRPMLFLNPYGVEMGTSGLVLQVEGWEEI